MTQIEIMILILVVLLGLPGLLEQRGRSGLIFPSYILLGVITGPLLLSSSQTFLSAAGEFGFMLLLFEIGLEIDVPGINELKKGMLFSFRWIGSQIFMVFLLYCAVCITLLESSVSSWLAYAPVVLIGLSSCSLSLVYGILKENDASADTQKKMLLQGMVVLELLTVLLLAVGDTILKNGWTWRILLAIAGIMATVLIVALTADHMGRQLKVWIDKMLHWRVHLLVLFVLIISALGERMGLSAAKTAFVLGLFIGRSTHEGMQITRLLHPVSHGLLIPVFFVALGTAIPVSLLLSQIGIIALSTACLLLAYHFVAFRGMKTGLPMEPWHWVLGPNLTMSTIAYNIMSQAGIITPILSWFLLSSFFMTVISVFMLPPAVNSTAAGNNTGR